MDSNHRRQSQQIYSLSPLATRELSHMKLTPFGGSGGAGGRIRTPDLLITNQLLYRLSYTSKSSNGRTLLYQIAHGLSTPKNKKIRGIFKVGFPHLFLPKVSGIISSGYIKNPEQTPGERSPMRYLFFDIEGVNNTLRAIGTLGYVLTDESFRVLEKRDVLFNPKCKFDWYVLKNLLCYAPEELRAQPSFANQYRSLQTLLEAPDTLVGGFSIRNDLLYLDAECRRNGLPPFRFLYTDIQIIVGRRFESQNQIGVETACGLLHIAPPLVAHRSDEDALATMRIAQALCQEAGLSLQALAEKYGALALCEGQSLVKKRRPPRRRGKQGAQKPEAQEEK